MKQVSSPAAALEQYVRIRENGLRPSASIIVAALKACSSLNDAETGARIHEDLLRIDVNMVRSNMFVANSLLDMYVKCGRVENAEEIFETMSYRSVVSWNSMILAYAQSGRGETALELFTRMKNDGFVPDARTFVAALKGCSSIANASDEPGKKLCMQHVKLVHDHVAKSRLESNIFVSSSLVDSYAKCGCMPEARSVFDRMPRYDSVCWNSLILGYVQGKQGGEALKLFQRMQAEGFNPDARTFVAAVCACSCEAEEEQGCEMEGKFFKAVSLERGMAVHARLEKQDLSKDAFVGSALVDMYSKCGSMVDAFHAFERMLNRDVVSWNALILGYAQSGQGEVALEIFCGKQAAEEFLVPNARTFGAAINACSSMAETEEVDEDLSAKVASLEKGMALHRQLCESGIQSDMFVESALLDLYSKCGSMGDASRVFQRMEKRDSVCWSTMICGYVQRQENEVALEFFWGMQRELEQEAADAGAFAAALKACGSLADLETGRRIHSLVLSSEKLRSDIHVANSLITFYGKCGSMDEARRVFDSVESRERDLITWSSLIAGYSHQGDAETVFDLFERMQKDERVQVDGVTFLSVLTLCCRAGLVDEGRECFRAMWCDHGIVPGIEHFTCMVDLLGKANYLDEAAGLLRSMPFQGDATIFTVLLDACCKWKNVEVGKFAFEALVRLDEHQPAAYVLMANTYADAGMMDESVRIRSLGNQLL